MDERYYTLISELIETSPKEAVYSGVRKIVPGVTFKPLRLPPMGLTYGSFGYGSSKHKQLLRNYWNPEEVSRVRKILDKRENSSFTSVSLMMRGQQKESRSMGWCMNALVISRAAGSTRVEIQYRSTEIILKFGADLVFLPWVFEQLEIEPEEVTFRFANCFLSGMYYPYLMTHWNAREFFDELWEGDRKFFERSTRFMLRSASREKQTFPFSPARVAHRFAWDRLGRQQMGEIREYLEKKHRGLGKSMPTAYHDEGYVPRKRRTRDDALS